VGDGQRRQGPGPGGHGPVSPGNRPSAQRVGRALVPYSALGRDAQRRPLRRLGRTRVVGAGGPRLLSPVSLRCITGVCGAGTSTLGRALSRKNSGTLVAVTGQARRSPRPPGTDLRLVHGGL